MRVYELEFWAEDGPFRTWYSSKAKLMTALAGYRREYSDQLADDMLAMGYVHKIPTDKAGLIEWLNGNADNESMSNPMEGTGPRPTRLPDVQ